MPFCIFYLFVVQIEFEFLEFKFNLNLFESSFKKNGKPFFLSLSLPGLQPSPISFSFSFLLLQPKTRPKLSPPFLPRGPNPFSSAGLFPGPVHPSPFLPLSRPPPGGPGLVPELVLEQDSRPSPTGIPALPRLHRPARPGPLAL